MILRQDAREIASPQDPHHLLTIFGFWLSTYFACFLSEETSILGLKPFSACLF
jgi:hypothetical protein